MSKIKHILSVIHCTICGAVCFQFTHFLCDDWENIYIYIYIYIYTLSYYHHQIGSMNYYPFLGLGHETMVCAVCLSIFLWRHRHWSTLGQVIVCCQTVPHSYTNQCWPLFGEVPLPSFDRNVTTSNQANNFYVELDLKICSISQRIINWRRVSTLCTNNNRHLKRRFRRLEYYRNSDIFSQYFYTGYSRDNCSAATVFSFKSTWIVVSLCGDEYCESRCIV